MIDLQGLSTFVKYASEILLGFPPKKLLDIMKKIPSLPKTSVASSDLPIKLLSSPKTSSEMKTMLLETFQTICHDLVEAHKQFRVKEAKFEKDRLLHGSLTEQKQIEFDNSKKLYEKLLSVATSLAEAIGEPIPELKVNDLATLSATPSIILSSFRSLRRPRTKEVVVSLSGRAAGPEPMLRRKPR